MSLKEEFSPDLDAVFLNPDEFGARHLDTTNTDVEGLEFEIVEDGQPVRFITNCVWYTEALMSRLIVQQQGVYMGSVLLFIHKSLFKVEPKAEQIIYTPVAPFKIGWRIVEVTDAEECYEIALDKLIA
jgi:hypothetical protein